MISKRRTKIALLLSVDFILINLAYILSFYFRSEVHTGLEFNMLKSYYNKIVIATLIYILIFSFFKLYKSLWSLAGIDEVVTGTVSTFLGCSINIILSIFMEKRIPYSVTLLSGIMVLLLCNGIRMSWRVFRGYHFSLSHSEDRFKRVLVIGAGEAGATVRREFSRNHQLGKKVVAFVDDDYEKRGTYIGGVKVEGNRTEIEKVVKKKNIDEIIIAIANLEAKRQKEIIDICKELKVKVNIMPSISELIDKPFSIKNIREVDVKDLLGREEIKLDHSGISKYIENNTIMVTGGGGSIGSELCRQIVKFNPKRIIIIDIYENNAYDIQNEIISKFPNIRIVTLIGSIRDKERLRSIFEKYNPEVVFHAAAHKHVPLMEESPMEAIKNNVKGTLNCVELASEYKVEKFVLISTDKAVNPTNVMGATKRLCEMIVQSYNNISKTSFVAVRFGNVLGSNGSVIPLFKKQIAEGGPLTLTHKNITRYFMLIPEAAQLVLQAGAYAKGGEIFVLDMGSPVKIYDLACDLIKLSGLDVGKDIKIKVTGLRPGEKLYEELLMNEEGLTETSNDKIFIGIPGEYDFEKIKSDIDSLLELANLNKVNDIKEKLREIVPTYKINENVRDGNGIDIHNLNNIVEEN